MLAARLGRAAVAELAHRSGVHSRKLDRCSRSQAAILMYHRVAPASELPRSTQAGMYVDPESFNQHIDFLKRRFDVVSLSAWATEAGVGMIGTSSRPKCVLTFDDGWADFHTHAFPVLKAHQVPATVFLPTDFIGTDKTFWTDRIGLILDATTSDGVVASRLREIPDPKAKQLSRLSGALSSRIERAIALLKPEKLSTIEEILARLCERLEIDVKSAGRAFMTWEEVAESVASGLVDFGSHTGGHPILTTLAADEAENELRRSRAVLLERGLAKASLVSFCYPNGGTSDWVKQLVRDCGYQVAVTTRPGWNRVGDDPFMLRRIGLHQDVSSSTALFASRITRGL